MRELIGNVLLLQIGKPTVITNVILSALIKKSLNYPCVEEIYGCAGGMRSFLSGQFIDLAGQQQRDIANLVGTPGAALKAIAGEDFDAQKVEILQKNNIRYVFLIGDMSAVGACKKLDEAAAKVGHEMRTMVIPTVADNSLQLTDHCLAYGSMAKHLASTAKSIIAHVQSTRMDGAITIVSLANGDDKWLLSSLALARLKADCVDAPQLVIFSNFDEGTFVRNVHQTMKTIGNCVIVVGSKLTNLKGEDIATKRSAAQQVKFVAEANFDVPVELITLSDWELTSSMTLSGTDVAEAELCAQKALEFAITVGTCGKMITLLRTDTAKYSSEVNCVDLGNVSDKRKEFPDAWYNYDEMALTQQFFKYAAPLIVGESHCAYENGVPHFAKLV
jgi:6-phosphofructokinase 1